MKYVKIIFFFLIANYANAQLALPQSAHELIVLLNKFATMQNSVERSSGINEFWNELRTHNKIPFTNQDTVVFLYRGKAEMVLWAGDFNKWGSDTSGYYGSSISNTDIWYLLKTFPPSSRLDYKIVINGREWILDLENEFKQASGTGSLNSELRMPNWNYPLYTLPNSTYSKGKLIDQDSLNSKELGYTVFFRIYLPAGYSKNNKYPVIYVTDGQEYADPKLGSMTTVLDNLIGENKIKPVIAVFIDPRTKPELDADNRRMSEYIYNSSYLKFVTIELIKYIDKKYSTIRNSKSRAILGTSLGGLNSAYFGIFASKQFQLIGIQSPAFWVKPVVFEDLRLKAQKSLKVFISTGTINDTQNEALKFKQILDEKGIDNKYIEVAEGHSWGNWRALVDDLLIYFF